MTDTKKSFARKVHFNRAAVLASLAISAVTVASPQAFAAVICSAAPFNIPANIDGIYVNFVTGSSGTGGSTTPGWDFNAYANGNVIGFFSSTAPTNTTRYVGIGPPIALLAPGTRIDASSPLVPAGTVTPGVFRTGVSNGYVGVVFKNEGTFTTNYGWVSLTTTGPNGFPATINEYCFSNDGTAIIAGGEKIFRNGFDG